MTRNITFSAGKAFLFEEEWNGDDENLVDIPFHELNMTFPVRKFWSDKVGHHGNDTVLGIDVTCDLLEDDSANVKIDASLIDMGEGGDQGKQVNFETLFNQNVPKDMQLSLGPKRINSKEDGNYADMSIIVTNHPS